MEHVHQLTLRHGEGHDQNTQFKPNILDEANIIRHQLVHTSAGCDEKLRLTDGHEETNFYLLLLFSENIVSLAVIGNVIHGNNT